MRLQGHPHAQHGGAPRLEPYFTVPHDQGWAQEDLLQMGRRPRPSGRSGDRRD